MGSAVPGRPSQLHLYSLGLSFRLTLVSLALVSPELSIPSQDGTAVRHFPGIGSVPACAVPDQGPSSKSTQCSPWCRIRFPHDAIRFASKARPMLTRQFRIWKEKYDPGNGKKGKK